MLRKEFFLAVLAILISGAGIIFLLMANLDNFCAGFAPDNCPFWLGCEWGSSAPATLDIKCRGQGYDQNWPNYY